LNYLIIGADGFIGGYLYCELAKTGSVVGTTRNHRRVSKNLLLYDMSSNPLSFFEDPFRSESNKTAIICAAFSSINQCHEEYEVAYLVNVVNTIKTIAFLVENGYHVIFLSSDNVFDGKKGFYTEEDVPEPINDYGKMKHIVEEYLNNFPSDVCILRLCKVVGKNNSPKDLFYNWKTEAQKKQTIRCVRDSFLSPVFIGDILSAIVTLSQKEATGIFHLGGAKRYNRTELCKLFLDSVGIKANIEECSVSDIEIIDGWPIDTSLVSEKIACIGLQTHNIEDYFYIYS